MFGLAKINETKLIEQQIEAMSSQNRLDKKNEEIINGLKILASYEPVHKIYIKDGRIFFEGEYDNLDLIEDGDWKSLKEWGWTFDNISEQSKTEKRFFSTVSKEFNII